MKTGAKKPSPKKTEKKKPSTFKPAAGKTWADKVAASKDPEVKTTDKVFADIPAGAKMLIPSPKVVDAYVRQIPKGKSVTLQTMRKDLAVEFNAEYTCPVTSGIFLRIVAEAAGEQMEKGTALSKVTPFWRVIDEHSTIAKKLSFGPDVVGEMRKKEGLVPDAKPKKTK